MKWSTILLTLLIGVLTACSSPTKSTDEFEPFQIGAWTIVSEDDANWTGTEGQLKAPSDTVVYISPENNSITITETGDKRADIVYSDSSYAGQEVEILWHPPQSIGILSYSTRIYDSHIEITLPIQFVCGYEGYSNDPVLSFSYEQDGLETIYKFDVDGLEETMFEILCVD